MLLTAIAKRCSSLWFYGIAAISAICVLATGAGNLLEEQSPLHHLRRLSMAGENDVGSWWSGMVLLVVALHAADGYFLYRERRPVSYAWGALAALMLALSLDEVGGVHERLSYAFGSSLALIPYGLVLGVLPAFALPVLWRDRDQRSKSVWIALALALFGLAIVQDFLPETGLTANLHLRSMLEEGTEVAAMLILLRVTMLNSRGVLAVPPASPAPGPVFEALEAWRTPIVICGVLALVPLAYLSAELSADVRAQPITWLSAAAFFGAAIAALRPFLQEAQRIGAVLWILSALFVLLAASAVAQDPRFSIDHSRLTLTALGGAIALLWFWMGLRAAGRRYLLASVLMAVVIALAWLASDERSLLVAYCAVSAAGMLALVTHSLTRSMARNASRSGVPLEAPVS